MAFCAAELFPNSAQAGDVLRVPEDYATIQGAINAAQTGDTVLVSPGTYTENLTIAGKNITLASEFQTSGNPNLINETIIDGGGETVITIEEDAGPDTTIVGFTIQNGNDGIRAMAHMRVLNNRITQTKDGIDSEGGGGEIRENTFENNGDDGIDFDGASSGLIVDNIIRNNDNDGIEIRLHQYSGPTLNIVIRGNAIHDNQEDGIQLIDYPDLSDRVFTIERNLIYSNAMVGLGLMDNGITDEDFRAASIPERIHLFNNTFAANPYAVTGGDNLIALNNLFVGSTVLGLKNVDGDSTAAYNLYWNNADDHQGSHVDLPTSRFADPLLDANYALQSGSPAIDVGVAHFVWNEETVLDYPANAYHGAAPDLGRYESNFTPATATPTQTPSATPTTSTPATSPTPSRTPPGSTHTPTPMASPTPAPIENLTFLPVNLAAVP
jgi:hypothetical protein